MTPLGSKATQGTRRFLRTALCLVLLMCALLSTLAFADDDHKTVRVGYYENEVFQEGASEGAVKTGYAYEYYRKLSEYTGWEYEYVYGDYVDLYQLHFQSMLPYLLGTDRKCFLFLFLIRFMPCGILIGRDPEHAL